MGKAEEENGILLIDCAINIWKSCKKSENFFLACREFAPKLVSDAMEAVFSKEAWGETDLQGQKTEASCP